MKGRLPFILIEELILRLYLALLGLWWAAVGARVTDMIFCRRWC